ncbi:MAG: GGDEF domain-containing protein [Tumebacillaceae bacterium]
MSFKQLAAIYTVVGTALVLWLVPSTHAAVPPLDPAILITLFALYAFTEFFPLVRNQHSISLSLSVDLLIFLKFGLMPLILISQASSFLGRWRRVGKIEPWFVVANGGMFAVTIAGAAGVFYLTGGTHEGRLSDNLFPLLAYIAGHLLFNHMCVYPLIRSMNGLSLKTHLTNNMQFDIVSSAIASTLGLILILLFEELGLIGLLAVGVPVILCVYVLKLFNDVSSTSRLFRNLASLTGNFSGELDLEAMCTRVAVELPKWFDQTRCVILVEQAGELLPLAATNGIIGDDIRALQAAIHQSGPSPGCAPFAKRADGPEFNRSRYRQLLIAPIISDGKQMGYCCLLSEKYRNFDRNTIDALSILANQLAVSFRIVMRYEDVEKQSLYDELTQLPNQRFGERRVAEEVLRAKGSGSPLSLLVMDIDHFKHVNDEYGHQAGNTVLNTLARTFECSLRKSDFISRYGGEEFIVVLPDADSDLALEIAEKIRRNVETLNIRARTMDGETAVISLTISIGVATFPVDADDPQQLIRFADRAMYIGAKRSGRNRVAVYEHETAHV